MSKKTTSDEVSNHMAAIGRKGGKARLRTMTAEERQAIAAKGGRGKAKPTVCPRCGNVQPTARAAWVHCRKPRKRKP